MTAAEIIQIVIGGLSLIATIAVSVVLALVENRRAKHQRKDALEQAAKEFIIDNSAEIEYLPLCIFARATSQYKTNVRQIYNRFNRCTDELQTEILCQRNIPIGIIKDNQLIDACLDAFDKQAKETKLWEQSWLYDGAKYFKRSLSHYRELPIDDVSPHVFEVPVLNERLKNLASDFKVDLTFYIDRYLEYVLKDREDTKNKPELLPQSPPINEIDKIANLGGCAEKLVCFWIMRFIQSGCIAFWRHNLVKDQNASWRDLDVEGPLIKTYEDMYYDTLLTLYTTYGVL